MKKDYTLDPPALRTFFPTLLVINVNHLHFGRNSFNIGVMQRVKDLSNFFAFYTPMLQQSDFLRAARYLVSRYGIEAGGRASRRAKALRDQGDLNGHRTWNALCATIADLQSSRDPAPDRAA